MPSHVNTIKEPFVIALMSAIIGAATYFMINKFSGKNLSRRNQWQAYLHKLDKIEKEVMRRTTEGYSLEKRLPTQLELLKLSDECLSLTEAQHGRGKGNYAAFFVFFYRICEKAQTTFYPYEHLLFQKSQDGFVTLLDGGRRAKLQQEYMNSIRKPFIDQGGLWAGGRSAIDNTILSTIMPKNELDAILATNGLKRYMLISLQKNQKRILQNVSHWLGFDLTKVSSDLVRKTLSDTAIPFAELKVNTNLLPFKLLLKYGNPIEDSGQLPDDIKTKLWQMSKDRFINSNCPLTELSRSFSAFVKSKPGEFVTSADLKIKSNLRAKKLHWLAQTVGLWSNQLGGLSRSSLENLTPIRYFPVSWTRKFPLADINDAGQRIIIRDSNSEETSMIRANQAPYQLQHGMSMSTSGFIEGSINHSNLLYRLGIPLKSGTTLMNLYCDIEKVLREVYLLNPKSFSNQLGERDIFLSVGQNAISGSSIQQTQHTHVFEGTLQDFPIYQNLATNHKILTIWGNEFEFVQVGKTEDAFYLKIFIANPIDENYIECMVNLRMSLLEKFGGSKKIDFHFHVIPDGKGKFLVIFAPIIRLERELKEGHFVFTNPDLGKTDRDLGLHEGCINLAQASGTWEVFGKDKEKIDKILKNGKAALGNLWDFTAKKGSRSHVIQFLQAYHKNKKVKSDDINGQTMLYGYQPKTKMPAPLLATPKEIELRDEGGRSWQRSRSLKGEGYIS